MTTATARFRIATYNIHKCRGFDQRTSPARIIAVLRELDADILCLQEVVNVPDPSIAVESLPVPDPPRGFAARLISAKSAEPRMFDQAGQIARAFPEYAWAFGANRPLRGGTYGNLTLTRLPLQAWRNHDVSRQGRERRGVLETELEIANGITLHIFNVHLGTGHMERRFQARKLLGPHILTHAQFKGPRLVIGDFNEWTRGLTTRLLRGAFRSFLPRHAARFPRTFPGMLPLLSLDHCYYEPPLVLEQTRLWRTRTALVASDHLPLIADFGIAEAET